MKSIAIPRRRQPLPRLTSVRSRFFRIARAIALLAAAEVPAHSAPAQQAADAQFRAVVEDPAFAPGEGPLVGIDAAHHNFHTEEGRYRPFADVLRADGYRVESIKIPFTDEALKSVRILVIANALHERNVDDWSLPTPSAFSPAEIEAVRNWVKQGGSLLLIADHMPFPGAAGDLAKAFDIRFSNGFAVNRERSSPLVFTKDKGMLRDHAILRGRNPKERVNQVATFTGQAFQVGKDASPLLVFPKGSSSFNPAKAWQFDDETPRESIDGWCQGAVLEFGKGRVAVIGEAAMFTAQVTGKKQEAMGLNSPDAPDNQQFLLNVTRWLAGLLGGP